MSHQARPVEGKLLTPTFKLMLLVWAAATGVGLVRFTRGLGAVAAMSDGYPWGLWIAFDVVVGTGLASGGYAVALLVYVLNRGRFHPLVRPALLTSLLGYGVAGVAVVFDVGKPWNLGIVPIRFWNWNGGSVLLEVALCMMAYTAVLAVELSPAILEGLAARGDARRAALAARWLPRIERALPFVLGFGLLLPTMHQSSLGSLLLIAGPKLHPLWHTAALPLLFLVTAFAMGWAIVFFESVFSSAAFRRPMEARLLGTLGTWAGGALVAFVGVRLATLVAEGRLGLAFGAGGGRAFFFWAELLLALIAAATFLRPEARTRPSVQLQGALLALAAGALYRVDAFLVAYSPGPGWAYFPSVGELMITLGFVATETMAYLVAVRRFPILAGVSSPTHEPLPAGARQGAAP